MTCSAAASDKEDFSRWEEAISAFERADRKSRPPEGAILFVGSSSIRKWELEKSFPERETINRGFGGSEIADSVHFADRIILPYQPRVIVLYAGDNDIAGGKSPKRVLGDFQSFVETVHGELPETRIVFLAIKPSLKRWKLAGKMKRANVLIEKECEQDGLLDYVDIFEPMLNESGRPREELFIEDGLHLNEKGYALWASLLEPYLRNGAEEKGSSDEKD